ncbi:ATP-binding protein [Streptomyces aquilus]|uniref:ATP-binding protein n=1 Tax=Streptomyces aquilus TaxID=2548456 RepID=A0A3Q9BUK1_9ACTN|nr:ATP-binding protein [Streptomyces aquilus]AZP14733.1 ATP-binding protein [Streptomyces aquilus]AZP22971.1 ATP-binding protein [Streptomyces aquilus]
MIAARLTPSGARRYTETLACEPASARRARLLVSAAVNAWGISEMSEAGMQIVAELVNNAVEHTRCRSVRVLVTRTTERRVRIAVADTCRETPEMGRPDGDAEGGRGLLLVDALSSRWGYDRDPLGKVVWAELEVPPTAEHQFAEALSLGTRTSRPRGDDAPPGSAPPSGSAAPCSHKAAPSAPRPPR